MAAQQDENYNLDDDLAVFTNAEFFDFDLGDGIEQPPIQYDPSQEERARRENAVAHKGGHKMDFINGMYRVCKVIGDWSLYRLPYLTHLTCYPMTIDSIRRPPSDLLKAQAIYVHDYADSFVRKLHLCQPSFLSRNILRHCPPPRIHLPPSVSIPQLDLPATLYLPGASLLLHHNQLKSVNSAAAHQPHHKP